MFGLDGIVEHLDFAVIVTGYNHVARTRILVLGLLPLEGGVGVELERLVGLGVGRRLQHFAQGVLLQLIKDQTRIGSKD